MATLVVCFVAFSASALTFVSGFGLGTLLLPAFALFYPIDLAVASTAVVHFLNSLFKLALVGRHADRRTVVRFGIPAILAAFLGARLLLEIADIPPIAAYTVLGIRATLEPASLVIGALLLLLTLLELSPRFGAVTVPTRYLPVGGLLSGFFGGLSGMQGALRSAFLLRMDLSKEAFIGTGVVIATLIDVSRLVVYAGSLVADHARLDQVTLAAAVGSAFLGAVLGHRMLPRLTMRSLRRAVGGMLVVAALGLMLGVL